jgi:hypothetical protein
MATEAAWLKWEQTHGKKKAKVCLDINRPSHGRTYAVTSELPNNPPGGESSLGVSAITILR